MRRAENHRRRDQADRGLPGHAFDPILNQSTEKKFFGKRGEEENSGENGRSGIELPQRKTVMDEINSQTEWNRNRREQQKILQSLFQNVIVALEPVADLRHRAHAR